MKLHRSSFFALALAAVVAGTASGRRHVPRHLHQPHGPAARSGQPDLGQGRRRAKKSPSRSATQSHKATAGDDGMWSVKLDAAAGRRTARDRRPTARTRSCSTTCLVGEVWLCSGQSNMEWNVAQSFDADLEALTAKYPQIRFITVPHNRHARAAMGLQRPVGSLLAAKPSANFSAVGYFFGRQLHQTLERADRPDRRLVGRQRLRSLDQSRHCSPRTAASAS